MATKPYDQMTREELDAWYERHQRWRGVRVFLVLLIVSAIAWAAWSTLRAWNAHTQAHIRAEQQRQAEELRNIEIQEDATGASERPCGPAESVDCNAQPQLNAPHTIVTAAPVPVSTTR